MHLSRIFAASAAASRLVANETSERLTSRSDLKSDHSNRPGFNGCGNTLTENGWSSVIIALCGKALNASQNEIRAHIQPVLLRELRCCSFSYRAPCWQHDRRTQTDARPNWKSHDLTDLSDEAIQILVPAIQSLPGPECEVFVAHIGGGASRISAESTVFPQRKPHFGMNVHARWRDAGRDQSCVDWARRLFDAMAPHAAGTAYVTFMPADKSERVESVYGGNFARLAKIKRRYDPSNLFRVNQNVKPSVSSPASAG